MPSIKKVAEVAGVSVGTVSHVITGSVNVSEPLRLKVQAAKQLLLQDGLNVKETASRLGFSSQFQFSRTFKRVEGISPKLYVRALTENASTPATPTTAIASATAANTPNTSEFKSSGVSTSARTSSSVAARSTG